MVAKRALIVDDSKSARVVLTRMLEKYGLEAESLESAEAAIEYLGHHRPDVIFMDHLMPGMDGFQAVQAIKSNPQTAMIPIMMYTSQQGEVYVGQARALGAVGVLPKLVKPVDVSKVLYQLRLLPDRRDREPSAFVEAGDHGSAMVGTSADTAKPTAALIPADWHPQLESALRNHDAELRRFVVASFDSFAGRLSSDVKTLLAETQAAQLLAEDSLARRRKPSYAWIAAVLVALVPGLLLGFFYQRAWENNQALAADNARLERSNAQLGEVLEKLAQSVQASVSGSPATDPTTGAETGGDGIATRLVEPVPYGDVPLAQSRVDILRELLYRLEQQSVGGRVRAEYFTGQFCLTGNATDGYALAPPELPVRKCDLIGNPFDESLGAAQHQSLAFANLVASVPRRTGQRLSVEVAAGADKPVAPYPKPSDTITAGLWNEIASRNSRVEFSVLPRTAAAPAAN